MQAIPPFFSKRVSTTDLPSPHAMMMMKANTDDHFELIDACFGGVDASEGKNFLREILAQNQCIKRAARGPSFLERVLNT